MNIATQSLNINDIKAAIKYNTMDKESLLSYIGKVILSMNLQNDINSIINIFEEVFYEILKTKYSDSEPVKNMAKQLALSVSLELNNYIATDNLTNEQIESIVEPFIDKISFANDADLINIMDSKEDQQLLSIGLVDDAIINEEITVTNTEQAKNKYNLLPEKITNIISNIKQNIIEKAKNFGNKVESIEQLDFWSKSALGLIADIFGGNLISKMIYLDVNKSEDMINKIREEGIVHFTSEHNVNKILNSGDNYIKASSSTLSGGKGKSYFFAGLPSFKDITINIYSYNVMYGVRIYPTEEQIKDLIYREYNDKAVAHTGNFHFKPEQVKKVFYGLKMDENKNLFYEEITEEQAKNYQVSEEVKNFYNGDNSLRHKVMCNAFGFYYEFENYMKLIKRIKERNFEVERTK